MDRRLLTHYEQELQYLRELGGEFARDYPKIAGHLGLDEFECADPYVERLIEGCALLAARVQLKMDAEFPRFTEHVLGMVSPHLLSPTPSMGVVQLSPSEARQATLVDGATVPRGTTLKASVGSAATPVVYRTGAEVELWPLEIVSLRHGQFLGDLGELGLSHGQVARGVLRIKIRSLAGVPLSALRLDKLPLFVRGEMARATRLYELLVGSSLGVMMLDAERVVRRCPNGKVRPLGLETDDSLLPSAANSFSGHRQLQEYFALPSRFLFVGLEGLREGLRHVSGSEAELVVVLDRYDAGL
jgi:type VI secretion system protein ImpG